MSDWLKWVTRCAARINTSGIGWHLMRWRWWRSLSPADRYLVDARVSGYQIFRKFD
jgi:hypothetical protein